MSEIVDRVGVAVVVVAICAAIFVFGFFILGPVVNGCPPFTWPSQAGSC